MFKKTMLALTFVATLGVVGVGVADRAEARRGFRRPWVARYYAPPVYYDYYGGYAPYRTYYGYTGPRYYRMGGPYYAPRVYYYDRGVSFGVGF